MCLICADGFERAELSPAIQPRRCRHKRLLFVQNLFKMKTLRARLNTISGVVSATFSFSACSKRNRIKGQHAGNACRILLGSFEVWWLWTYSNQRRLFLLRFKWKLLNSVVLSYSVLAISGNCSKAAKQCKITSFLSSHYFLTRCQKNVWKREDTQRLPVMLSLATP